MDTTEYLTRQGWSGHGHSLDARGRGICKPLLVSKKNNSFGVGMRKHDVLANQWWNTAFEAGLKAININPQSVKKEEKQGQEEGQAVNEKKTSEKRKTQAPLRTKWGSLYTGFVKGDTLDGSMNREAEVQSEEDQQAEEGDKGPKETRKNKRKGHRRGDGSVQSTLKAKIESSDQQSDSPVAVTNSVRKKSKKRSPSAAALRHEANLDAVDVEKQGAREKKQKKRKRKRDAE